jgi:tRNA (guanine-N7-)-methyltransferase
MSSAHIETEFGVPIPGAILPQERWAKTAIKKLPPSGPLDFAAIFHRTAPIVLDIGCGNGRFTLASAIARPNVDHLATDILPVVIRYATRRGNQRGLSNVRFAVIGGRELLRDYIAAGAVAEVHVYHPQPYYERRQHRYRLITPEFLSLVHRALVPGGLFVVQTDNPPYWHYIREVAKAFFAFADHPAHWPEAPHGRTRREILALQEGLPVFRGTGTPRAELSEADLSRLVAELPLPRFNSDRRLARLDSLDEINDSPIP